LVVLIPVFCGFINSAHAQQNAPQCRVPALKKPSLSADFFTDEQENELGRVIDSQVRQSQKIIEEPELTGYLYTVGDRLQASLPPSGLRFHYYLVDLPDENAFSIPGGYVYVSRKLISFMRSEDELAAVLAHEMGHIVTHQGAIRTTRQMKELLNIDHVSEPEIFDRYNQMLEKWRQSPSLFRRTEESEQDEADRVSILALAASGYPPATMPDFFDRFAELKGKKGSWFSDVFGSPNPNGKRLREGLKEVASLPAACRQVAPCPTCADTIARQQQFKQWQARVAQYSGIGHKETLPPAVLRKKLQPALRSDLRQIQVSPDGKYLFAQDEAGIAVYSRQNQSLEPLFWIDAVDARPAHFSPDSQRLSFYARNQLGSPPWKSGTWPRAHLTFTKYMRQVPVFKRGSRPMASPLFVSPRSVNRDRSRTSPSICASSGSPLARPSMRRRAFSRQMSFASMPFWL
jgi:hypothetical protein